jgi:hypothetical protein
MADYKSSDESRFEGISVLDTRVVPNRDSKSSIVAREVHLEVDLSNLTKELTDLLLSKHRDYGPKNISQAPGGAINGLRVRMHDKLARINNLVDSGASPEHESLEDSFKDMANYAIIGLLVLRNKWDNESIFALPKDVRGISE